MFQSARQIWVGLNQRRRLDDLRQLHDVSICQADLGWAELDATMRRALRFARVSICQADLGWAELDVMQHPVSRVRWGFNLPGRFGLG